MKCKQCKREIAAGSTFCNWCGKKQVSDKQRGEIPVPEPRQLSSGKWFIQLRINGESRSVTEETPELCRARARATKTGLIEVKSKPADLTLKEAVDNYIISRGNRLKDRSKEQYEYVRDNRFQALMPMKLAEITKERLDKAVEAELSKPSRKGGTISPKTVKDAYMLIVSVMHKCAPDVDTSVQLPEIQRSFPELIQPEQIFAAVVGTDVELACLLSMWLSLSMSEIRGLTKSKSIRGDKLYIVETVVDVKGKPVRKQGGKEETRPRVLDIPLYIKNLLEAVKGDIIERRSGHAIYMRFQKVLEVAGLPRMRFHDLRHINASVMADIGVPSIVAQERGGWKTDSTMKKVYTHTFDSSRREADKLINAYFDKLISPQIANVSANKKK